jgi:membrane protease YdiL (CAAX protease family)
LLLPVFTSLVAVAVHILFGGTAPQFPLLKRNQHLILLTFVFYLLPWQSSAFLEEVGFRGYAQEQVQKRYGPLLGTLVLGVFFGAWLLPEFLRSDSSQYAMGGLRFYPWFILTEIGWSVIMAWVYNKTGKSALISGYLFHTAFNVWPFVLLTNAIPGEPLPAFDTSIACGASSPKPDPQGDKKRWSTRQVRLDGSQPIGRRPAFLPRPGTFHCAPSLQLIP